MLSVVQTWLDDLMGTSGYRTKMCQSDSEECRTFYLGSLIKSLAATGVYPLPSPETYKSDVQSCRSQLQEALLNAQTLSELNNDHEECSPFPNLALDVGFIKPSIPLTEAQRKRMSEQAIRSGILSLGDEDQDSDA